MRSTRRASAWLLRWYSKRLNTSARSQEVAVRNRRARRDRLRGIFGLVRFEKVWIEQCRATRTIKRRFGAKSALDYLIGEKLPAFADAAKDHPEFAAELPRFLSAIYRVFNPYEVIGYVATRKPRGRKALQRLLLIGRP